MQPTKASPTKLLTEEQHGRDTLPYAAALDNDSLAKMIIYMYKETSKRQRRPCWDEWEHRNTKAKQKHGKYNRGLIKHTMARETRGIASAPRPARSQQPVISFYRWLHHWSCGDYTVVYAPIVTLQMRASRLPAVYLIMQSVQDAHLLHQPASSMFQQLTAHGWQFTSRT